MPRVTLGDVQREAARKRAKEDAVLKDMQQLTRLAKTAKGRLDKRERDIAQEAGVSLSTLCAVKRGEVATLSLQRAVNLFHAIGGTEDDALRIFGFR